MKRKKVFYGAICLVIAGAMTFTACNNGEQITSEGGIEGVTNENTTLVLSSEALDGVFNPFYYTTGADGNVIGQTQIGMLSTDKDGNLVCGENEPCVVYQYTTETVGSLSDYESSGSYDNYYTDYWFAIKNGIKFSNGSDLTIRDVIFNLYVLLDPTYTGSSTLYSTNIQGLAAYRAQSYDESEQEGFDEYYETEARLRIDYITQWCDDEDATRESLKGYAEEIEQMEGYSILEYIDHAKTLFKEELSSDWTTAATTLTGESEYETKFGFTETWQVYLAMEGLVTFRTDDDAIKDTPAAVQWNGFDKLSDYSQEAMTKLVYDYYVGDDLGDDTYKSGIKAITSGGWVTASNLLSYVKAKAIEESVGEQKVVPTISGIQPLEDQTTIGHSKLIELDGTYDVLKIRVNGVDPKAIYNFSFTVAPMYYYSTPEEVEKFDYAAGNVGVPFAGSAFFDRLRKIQVPVGAGPYKASVVNSNVPDDEVPEKADFFRDNTVYYERNNYFKTVGEGLSNAKIRKLRYQVVSSTQLFDTLTGSRRTILYGTPTARQSYIQQLGTMSDSYSYALASTLGYGYIGINAGEIEEVEIRRAIMHAFNPQLCLDYYGDASLASIIYRPMTTNSWVYKYAYPGGATPYYAYDSTGQTSAELAAEAGYTLNSSGKLSKNGKTLKFTFTIAGETDDHPATAVLRNAADILNRIGFDITVTTDANALRKLTTGGLQVWAAAWSSTIDPDMYQVYHKDSNATSTNNWGYDDIYDDDKADTYYREIAWIDELSEWIDEAREMLDQPTRAEIYERCLDRVMELAVEFPTYQRNDLYVWNNDYLDSNTMAEATAYQSPLSRIWEVSFIEDK